MWGIDVKGKALYSEGLGGRKKVIDAEYYDNNYG
jgi:hypothetical protein